MKKIINRCCRCQRVRAEKGPLVIVARHKWTCVCVSVLAFIALCESAYWEYTKAQNYVAEFRMLTFDTLILAVYFGPHIVFIVDFTDYGLFVTANVLIKNVSKVDVSSFQSFRLRAINHFTDFARLYYYTLILNLSHN